MPCLYLRPTVASDSGEGEGDGDRDKDHADDDHDDHKIYNCPVYMNKVVTKRAS